MSETKDKDKDIGVPEIRGKFDQLVTYGVKHMINAPDHEYFNVPGCIACWMARNLGAAIMIADTVLAEFEKNNA